jgi:molybdenum cofactor biosynthesis protein B
VSASSRQHKATAPTHLSFAIIMCSTSRFAQAQQHQQVHDLSGDFIVQQLTQAGHTVDIRVLVPDDARKIRDAVNAALGNTRVAAVIICGGTGISPNDVTIETVTPLLRKALPGFGELFRKLSYESIGSAALLSRAVAGIADGKALFCIPGSLDAVSLCLDKLILPETGHIVKHARETV